MKHNIRIMNEGHVKLLNRNLPLVLLFVGGLMCYCVSLGILSYQISLRSFCVPCCDIRYDFRMQTMFDSSLSQVVCRRIHVLITLFVFVCVKWCLTYFVICFLVGLSSSRVSCAQCCQFL